MQAKILVVEDDADINRILCRYLEKERYEVVPAFSGSEALLQISRCNYDLFILDLMLPGFTGEYLITEIRKSTQTPIIIISAKSGLDSKVNALKSGADDYITKPFERDEVLARVEALLRRSKNNRSLTIENQDITFKELILKQSSREVLVKGSMISLTAYEYEILKLLLIFPDKVFTKEQLYQEIWKNGYYGEDNTINVHVSNIRKKIKDYDDASYIKTVWGIGFKLDTGHTAD